MTSKWLTAILFVVGVGLTSSPAAQRAPIDWDNLDPERHVAGELLIGFHEGTQLTDAAPLHQAVGSEIVRSFDFINGQCVKIPEGMSLKRAAGIYGRDPRVRVVEPNYMWYASETIPDDPDYPELWGMERIEAPLAWDTTTGNSNFVIAVIDTGVQRDHVDLAANTWINPGEDIDGDGVITAVDMNGVDDDGNTFVDDFWGWDAANNDNDPDDDNGHGSHCAGTIGAVGDNGIGVVGVNWTVRIAGLKFLTASGSGSTDGAIVCVDYCRLTNIQLSNNSWGGGGPSQLLEDAIQAAGEEANHLFVAAAGNSSSNNDSIPHYPSNYDLPNIVSVAAIDVNGAKASFSNYGAISVDLGAPGVNILSTIPSNAYDYFQGTSMACPHVAGAAAFLWGLEPVLPWIIIRDAILEGAEPLASMDGITTTGGELNLVNSLALIGGQIEFDQGCYRSDAVMTLVIRDFNVDPSINEITTRVELRDPSGVVKWADNITLTRVGTSSEFEGMLDLTTIDPPPVHGDGLYILYTDATFNLVEASTFIDDVAPVIFDPVVALVNSDEAVITWKTDEPADSRMIVSEEIPPTGLGGLPEVGTTDLTTEFEVVEGVTNWLHSVTATDLEAATLYFVALLSADCAGNETTLPPDLSTTDPDEYLRIVTLFRKTIAFYNLEEPLSGWVTSNVNVEVWQHGRPIFGPETAFSGENVWGTVLNDRYPILENAWVESPRSSVSVFPRVEFETWYQIDVGRPDDPFDPLPPDMGFVEIDSESGWENVTAMAEGFPGTEFITGDAPYWQHIKIDLIEITNKSISVRFRLDSNGEQVDTGWYFDDLHITDADPPGINIIDYEIDDSAGGDDDGFAEPGESFFLNLLAFNSNSTQTFENVAATVESPTAGVNLSSSMVYVAYGTMRPGDTIESEDQIPVSVESDIIDGTLATFFHQASDTASNAWSHSIIVQIAARESIRGTVTNLFTGDPIAEAIVMGLADGYPEIEAETDLDGQYNLHGGVPGVVYTLHAAKPGEFSRSPDVDVTAPVSGIDFGLGMAFANPSPSNLAFIVGQSQTDSQALTLDNTAGNIALEYTVEIDYVGAGEWLFVTPEMGAVDDGTASDLAVTVNSVGLIAGTYEADIILVSNDVGYEDIVIPVLLTVEISPVLYLAGVNIIGGDGDPFPEPDELVDFDIVLGNNGDGFAFDVEGTLSYPAADGNATVVDPSANWFFIEPGGGEPSDFDPTVQIEAGAVPGTELTFDLAVSDFAGNSWDFTFTLTSVVKHAISGTVTEVGTGTPVEGAVVTARGDNRPVGTTDSLGNYTIYDIDDDTYTVTVLPPLPYSQPTGQTVVVNGADVTGINFEVAAWEVSANPTSIVVNVNEGEETSTILTVNNDGPIDGAFDFRVEAVGEIPTDLIGIDQIPAVDWAVLEEDNHVPNQLLVLYKDRDSMLAGTASIRGSVAKVVQRYKLIPAALVQVPANRSLQASAAQLASDPNILRVEPNYLRKLFRAPNDIRYGELWGMKNIRQNGGTLGADISAEDAWETTVGSENVVVAILDTGIDYQHDDLANNTWINPNEEPGDANGDGYPGVQGVDDDGDGFTDFEDPEVMQYFTDGRDGDLDFTVEDELGGLLDDSPGNIGVDDDFDGVIDDYDGAIFDDDENGYPDDIYGWDFGAWDWDSLPDFFGFGSSDHGTHVAGTVGAVGNNTNGVAGVNWNVSLMNTKISALLLGFFVYLPVGANIAALDYAVDMGAHISNHSYGGPLFSGVEREAFIAAGVANHLAVVAAGNDGMDNDLFAQYPASYNLDNIISVAAADHNDLLATFSNWGESSVDLAAPGVDTLSTIFYDGYGYKSGTSMASPHVAGVAALLKSISPEATPLILRQAILQGARPDARFEGLMTTPGHLDAAGAIERLESFWIDIDPETANIASGGSVPVTVNLNVGKRLVAGTYEANIIVQEDRNGLTVPVTLNVMPAPVPKYIRVTVDDAAPGGDGDGNAEPGETVNLIVTLLNEGSVLFLSPTGTLSTPDAGITIDDDSGAWPGMLSGEIVESTDNFQVTISGAAPDPVTFDLHIEQTGFGPWDLTFELPVTPRNSISGTLRDSVTSDPVAGQTVEYWGAVSGRVTTDGNGDYRIDGLPDGTYRVRPLPDGHEKPMYTEVTLAVSDEVVDFDLRAVDVLFSTHNLEVVLPIDLDTEETVTIENDAAADYEFDITEFPSRKVALISDGNQLTGMAPFLEAMGFEVTVYTTNLVTYVDPDTFEFVVTGQYSGDDAVMFNQDLVIADLTGEDGLGRLVNEREIDVFEQYLAKGKVLILTGANVLTLPDDADLAAFVGAESLDRTDAPEMMAAAEAAQAVTDFVEIEPGQAVAVDPLKYDLATEDDVVLPEVMYKAGTANKLMRRVSVADGSVYLWSGNFNAAEWMLRGAWRDVLKNIIVDELSEDVSWLEVETTTGTVDGGTTSNLTIKVDANGLNPNTYRANLLVRGNYPGIDTDYINVEFMVTPLLLEASSTTGVRDWMNRLLLGDGGPGSSLFQLVYAGEDGMIQEPSTDGKPMGDDLLLPVFPSGVDFARMGVGFESLPDGGMFEEDFEHNLGKGVPVKNVYIRAWDAATIEDSIAYGDSDLYEIQLLANERHDFGAWFVDKVLGYPGPDSPDSNDDSVPDGWYVKIGEDPRTPIEPLEPELLEISVIGELGNLDGRFQFPAKAFYSENFLFVLDCDNNRIQVFNRTNETFQLKFGVPGSGDGEFSQPQGMGRHPTENKFAVADTQAHRIQIFTFDPVTGAIAFQGKFGSLGISEGQFNRPFGVAVGPLGSIYVADTDNHRVQILSEAGAHIRTIGTFGVNNGQFQRPHGIDVDNLGLIYVADTHNNRLQGFNGTGTYLWKLGTAGTEDGQFQLPRDVQVGLAGRILVADTSNNRIQIFDRLRNHVASLGIIGSLPEQFRFPYGVTPVPEEGNVYVVDTFNHRIQYLNLVLDGDEDGMDDTWEENHGLDSTDPTDSLEDPDGDGVMNIGEFRIGTDPFDRDSDDDGNEDRFELDFGSNPAVPGDLLIVKEFSELAASPPDLEISWTAEANQVYRIESTTDIKDDASWMPEPGMVITSREYGVISYPIPDGPEPDKSYRVIKVLPF